MQCLSDTRLQDVAREGAELEEVLHWWLHVFGGGVVEPGGHEGLVQGCAHRGAGERWTIDVGERWAIDGGERWTIDVGGRGGP